MLFAQLIDIAFKIAAIELLYVVFDGKAMKLSATTAEAVVVKQATFLVVQYLRWSHVKVAFATITQGLQGLKQSIIQGLNRVFFPDSLHIVDPRKILLICIGAVRIEDLFALI
ncbi:hypothetical protein D9M69_556200 [compost metagenome]